jgi:Asp-tRNA(Asn)/Glu-tRNA(Gln) amidotransferase A subunit family amidase
MDESENEWTTSNSQCLPGDKRGARVIWNAGLCMWESTARTAGLAHRVIAFVANRYPSTISMLTYILRFGRNAAIFGLSILAFFSVMIAPPVQAQISPSQPEVGPIESHVRSLQAQFDRLEPTRKAWISTDWNGALRTAQDLDRAPKFVDSPPSQPTESTQTTPRTPPAQPAAFPRALIDRRQQDDPLFGLVVGVKDNIDVAGFATTAGSNSLRSNRPSRDATVVARLRSRGIIIAGKTNLDTFARGVRTQSEVRGQTANAWDANRAAGGSSGGSAVAVASEMVDAALGTDTCGSLRYPATYNGIYSLRPTSGLLSRHGVVPLAPSQDTVGPMARTPTILRNLLTAMLGEDPQDPATGATATTTALDLRPTSDSSERPTRIGVLKTFGPFATDAQGHSMLVALESAGIELVPVSLPKGVGNASLIEAEADSAIGSFRVWSQRRSGVGGEVAPWLKASWKPVSARWTGLKAQQRNNARLLTELLNDQRLAAIAYPTTPFVAAALASPQPSANCWLSATSGLPALAIPGGFTAQLFPSVGIDLLGRARDEATLLDIAEIVHATR